MLESELKLGAGPAFHLPDLSGVLDGVAVTPPEAVRLETVYYDTPDLRLARWGVSLRHRAGEGWTLKLPPAPAATLLERDELEFQGGAATKPEAEYGNDGGKNRDHARDGRAVAQTSPAFLGPSEF